MFDLPEQCDQSFIDGLRTRLVEQTTASWMFWYGLLQDYAEENGDARPAKRKLIDGFLLGKWVGRQRDKKNELSTERIALLESLPQWSWDVLVEQWDAGFQFLKAYVEETGSARPSAQFKTKDGFHLSKWVYKQRAGKDTLSSARIALLEALPGWKWSASK